MRTNTLRRKTVVLAAILWLGSLAANPVNASNDPLQIAPRRIEIGTFFNGGEVSVSAAIPPGSDVVVELIGKKTEEDLMRKGRHWDIWMNVDEIDIKGVPRLYYVASSRPEMLDPGQGHFPWGYASLKQSARFEDRGANVGHDELFREFIRLMEEKGLYAVSPSAVAIASTGPDSALARVRFPITTRIAPGVYDLRLSIVRGHTVVGRRQGDIEVALVGLPSFLDALASAHRVLYGLLAVVVAACVGLLSGFAFKSKAKPAPKEDAASSGLRH